MEGLLWVRLPRTYFQYPRGHVIVSMAGFQSVSCCAADGAQADYVSGTLSAHVKYFRPPV
jgi:hypothetical protein